MSIVIDVPREFADTMTTTDMARLRLVLRRRMERFIRTVTAERERMRAERAAKEGGAK